MGRKRKANADRYPSGQVKYPAPLPHRQRMVDYARLRDPMLGSPLGMMLFEKRISPAQYDAGMDYRAARERADRLIGLPPRHAKGQDLSAATGRASRWDDDELPKRAQRRLDDMEAAIGMGSRQLAAVQAVVVYELAPTGHEQFLALCDGLQRLALWRKVVGR